MVFVPRDRSSQRDAAALAERRILPNIQDIVVFALVLAVGVLLVHGAQAMRAPMAALDAHPVSLDIRRLPEYGVRTTLRMFAAMAASLLFTFTIATWAAKSRRAERVIVPALDILQSVPVLGFLTFTVTFFIGLAPNSQVGAELASIFAIFTSQAWNMAFSFYQSLRTVPRDLDEVCRGYRLSPWQRFWRLEAPFAAPGLIWNMMMSMSGGWFFVVASEAITVGNTTVTLPGIGSYLSVAIARQDFAAVGWAVLAMGVLILLYDQLLFRPIVAWADKFRVELTAYGDRPQSWLYDLLRRTQLLKRLVSPLGRAWDRWMVVRIAGPARARPRDDSADGWGDRAWQAATWLAGAVALWIVFEYARRTLAWSDVAAALGGGFATLLRVIVLIALASVIWVPIGVWIGLRPRVAQRVQPLAQFLAAFPANVLFPFAVVAIVSTHANPDIWLSPLMVLGTQWYILFNVIAGAGAFPNDLREAATVYRLRSWTWWRRVILPGIFPYYLTGALTASGGSWNASIVAELARWGDRQVEAYGLGSYIARATEAGDYPRVVLGVGVMALFVTFFNRAVWRRLYVHAERRLRLN